MTEKEVYKNGVALLEEWEDVNYCEHSFKFKDEWLTDKEVVDKLNELTEENERLKQLLDYADDLIQSHLSEHYIRQWRNFKTGHKEYNDFWEEKLKKHKELKEGME